MSQRTRLRLAAALATALTATALAATAGAQDPGSFEGRLKARFRSYDMNESGWLSGREIDSCACRVFDQNDDGTVTWDEFRDGATRAAAGQQRAVAKDAAPAGGAAYEIGDRVEVLYENRWQRGSVVGVRDGRYQVSRDGWIVLQNTWFAPAEMRRIAPEQPAARARTLTGEWRYVALELPNGSRVELHNRGGTLTLNANGTFEQSLATASTSSSLNGRYAASGNRVTLYPENRDPLVYTAAIGADGTTLALRSETGAVYRLSR
jgi:hypothetical protein